MSDRLLLLVLVALAACGGEPAAPSQASGDAAALTGARVQRRQLALHEHVQGELSAYEDVPIAARITAYVESVAVDRGSVVRRGDVLARLRAPELGAQRQEAQARVGGDQTTLARLRSASQTEGAVAGHDVELAEASVAAGNARIASLRDLERYLVVVAPFDGIVTERDVHPGSLVMPGGGDASTMFRVADVARLRLVVALPERLTSGVRPGAEVEFHVRAQPEQSFRGAIVRSASAIDPRTRTMSVEADVDNHDGRLAPGMYAAVEWPVPRDGPSLLVPRRAVVADAAAPYVVRVRAGHAERVPVGLGAVVDDDVEVHGALAEGDTVLARGDPDIASGSAVRVTTSP